MKNLLSTSEVAHARAPNRQLQSARQHRAHRRGRLLRDTVLGYSFLAPTMVLFTLFYFYPAIQTILNGFYQFNLISTHKRFVGLKNYQTILQNGDFQTAIWHTLVYTFFTVLFSTAISLVLAVLMNQKIRGRNIYRVLYFLPVIAPSVASSIVFTDLFYNDNTGAINHILTWFHIGPIAWLGDPHYAMATVVMYSVWSNVGYNMVIYLAGLQGIPQSYYEAAQTDGASGWVLFRRITLPLLAPTTLFVAIVGVIGAFQVFNQVYVMTQGGPLNATTVIVFYIYQAAFTNFQGGTASAMSVILFVILLVLSMIQLKLFSRKE